MNTLFESAVIGKISARNRFIRSATLEQAAAPGNVFADNLIEIYRKLTDGGVGIIITGMMSIHESGLLIPSMINAGREDFTPQLRSVAAAVHTGGGRLVVQLAHCGIKVTLPLERGPLGPSALETQAGRMTAAMNREDIEELVQAFAAAAARCREAGADGVQLHAAHGYLLSQFLSPRYNRRQDEYGGGIANRARLVYEVYDAVRKAVGPDYPIWIKINSWDMIADGMTREESLAVCKELDRRGIDAVEISGGIVADRASSSAQPVRSEEDEGRFAPEAAAVAAQVNASVISVCGYRTPALAEQWLRRAGLAGVSLCRPLIREPGLVRQWQNGDPRKAACISCNRCFSVKGGVSCPHTLALQL